MLFSLHNVHVLSNITLRKDLFRELCMKWVGLNVFQRLISVVLFLSLNVIRLFVDSSHTQFRLFTQYQAVRSVR